MPTTSPSPRRVSHRTEKVFVRTKSGGPASKDIVDRAAVKAELKKVNRKTVDLGKPLGPYDTNSVRDRVRQWQAQGGGVVTAEDNVVVDSDQESPTRNPSPQRPQKRTPSTPARLDANREPTKPLTRSGGRKNRVEEEERERDRSGSAPRKRVISDGHWRKKGAPPLSTTTTGLGTNTASPRRTLPDDGIRVRAIAEEDGPHQSEIESKRSTPSKRRLDNDGIKVYSTPPRSRSGHLKPKSEDENRRSSGSKSGDKSDEDRPSSRTTPTPPRSASYGKATKEKPNKSTVESEDLIARESSKRRRSSRQESHAPETPSRTSTKGGYSEKGGNSKGHRQQTSILHQVFGEGKKIFTKQETPQPPKPGNRIEAWLSDTADPFLETQEPAVPPPVAEDQVPRNTEMSFETMIVNDDLKSPDNLETPEEGKLRGSRRRKRVRSSMLRSSDVFSDDLRSGSPIKGSSPAEPAAKLVDIVGSPPKPTPPSLKRAGARRSATTPTKEKTSFLTPEEPPFESVESVSVVSSSDASSIDAADPKFKLQPPGLLFKRPFPSTGRKRLSTIASVETFNTYVGAARPHSPSEASESTIPAKAQLDETLESENGDTFDPNSMPEIPGRHTSLKRRLTTHADLISVLSVPKAGSKSIQSARSIRTNRSRLATATIGDLMTEFGSDETKYMRELRTLVDGVIPVLLTCVLSKSDSAVAAGLFSPSANAQNDPNITRPIVDMGIALERLKTLHKRVPLQDPDALLSWAQGAQRVYTEYLKSWRMGFQDVVVNLAPAMDESSNSAGNDYGSKGKSGDTHSLYEGLPMNEEGDVVDADGERVDVAFLLKRPLVRLKYLAKTLKGINYVKPSTEAESLATRYQNLVIDARHRANEERARLEDEAASSIDPTRAREPRTLGPLTGVIVDRTRRVRARDYFSMNLQHTSGQRIDCRIELLLRDDPPEKGSSGDLLICEVDTTGRWLLFPPIAQGRVSARNGDLKGEIVVMIRGIHRHGEEWQEIMVLGTDDEQAGFEWVQMLGLTPVPPKLLRTQSFVGRDKSARERSVLSVPGASKTLVKSRTPSPREIEIPIGEQPRGASKTWEQQTPAIVADVSAPTRLSSKSPVSVKTPSLHKDDEGEEASPPSSMALPQREQRTNLQTPTRKPSRHADESSSQRTTPRSLNEAMRLAGGNSDSGLRRTKAKRRSRYGGESPTAEKESPEVFRHDSEAQTLDTGRPSTRGNDGMTEDLLKSPSSGARLVLDEGISVDLPQRFKSDEGASYEPLVNGNTVIGLEDGSKPQSRRSLSSVPSSDLPTIPKIRKSSQPSTPVKSLPAEDDLDTSCEPQEQGIRTSSSQRRPRPANQKEPLTTPTRNNGPPPPPPHRSSSPVQLKGAKTPKLGSPASARKTHRRSSSPLKHEYAPSSATDSSSGSEYSVDDDGVSIISTSSSDEELEDGETSTPLPPTAALRHFSKSSPQASLYSMPNGTLSPSQSASQAPYKTVPPQPMKASKTIALIYSWSDKGSWDVLHPDECSIVITPGLIEAFEMNAAHSRPATADGDSNTSSVNQGIERPLVALELTPLVPLRRGTALDISIRSPPTSNSKITSGNNIMFRSRSPEECEALYSLINTSRINNPTYIALQNARGPYNDGFASFMDRRNSQRGNASSSSWFGLSRKNSYRASSAAAPSIAASESSVGSLASAFSALKRFGNGGRMFNVARSTISSRNGSGSNSIYSSSSGSSSPLPPPDPNKGSPIGLSNAKIRLYARETASKWRDMGSARLTIMHPPPGGPSPGSPGLKPSGNTGLEKRIVVHGKTKGECLLDVYLAESCFERVARTGIALSVWEETMGPNGEVGMVGAVGGVGGTRARVYMIQMKTEAETAYTFSLVGKLRY
ncbi:MAG: hypothetical protein M1812_002095 [Candelaria pacifica]|nr:MAG: hypothetical protein M1812_002095 [Candelaria pacifica]